MSGQSASSADWRKMTALLGDAAEADSVPELTDRVLEHARELWGADLSIMERFDTAGRPLAYQMNPAPEELIVRLQPIFVALWPQHPYSGDLIPTVASGAVSLLSDRISHAAFQQTGLWNEVYVHLQAKNQMIMGGAVSENEFWTLGLNRLGQDFGPRDRELGLFAQPRLTRLLQRHAQRQRAQWTAQVLARNHAAYLVVDELGHILEMSPGARSLFEATRTPLPANAMLPASWRNPEHRATPLKLVRHSLGSIEAVRVPAPAHAPALILLGRTDEGAQNSIEMTPLTARESEVLQWIAEGKTNTEIGVLLGISARTVEKHCERVFEKLGVENRLSAALTVRKRCG